MGNIAIARAELTSLLTKNNKCLLVRARLKRMIKSCQFEIIRHSAKKWTHPKYYINDQILIEYKGSHIRNVSRFILATVYQGVWGLIFDSVRRLTTIETMRQEEILEEGANSRNSWLTNCIDRLRLVFCEVSLCTEKVMCKYKYMAKALAVLGRCWQTFSQKRLRLIKIDQFKAFSSL